MHSKKEKKKEKKRREKIKKREKKDQEGTERQKERNLKTNELNMRSGRRPGPEDSVAVCLYGQSCDMPSWWIDIRASQEDQTEGKKTRKG